MFNHVTIAGVIALVVAFLNNIQPLLPHVWGNLVAAFLLVYTTYYGAQAVSAARAAGVRGV